MTLTKREKLLLFIMALLAVVLVMMMLVILPLNQQIDSLKIDQASLESQKTIIDSTLPLLPILKTRQEGKVRTVNEELAKIESPIDGAEFERWMLPLTTFYNMRVTEMSVSEKVVSEPSGNIVLVNEPVYGLKTLLQGFTGDIEEVDSAPVSNASLLKMTVNYGLITNYTRFKTLLSEISLWDTTFFVTDSDYNFATGAARITIDAYMVHKISYEGDPDYFGDYHSSGNYTGGSDSVGSNNPGGGSDNPGGGSGNPDGGSNPDDGYDDEPLK